MNANWENDEAIQRLREYLRIPSVHPDVDYSDCVKFLKKQASEIGLPIAVYEFVPKKPVVVMTCVGLEPEEPSILLNSHMDVVPVYEEQWTYPPFEATINEDGLIYARGAQDMKSIGMMHLEAIRRLKQAGTKLQRSVHISFVPDEEIGSYDGMRQFAASKEFKMLNIGFALDESGPYWKPDGIFVCCQERTIRQITVTCKGTTGHGSAIFDGAAKTAGEKLYYVINKFMTLRAQEQAKVEEKGVWFGDVTTINITQLQGGVQINVLPDTLSVSFDIRVACDVDHDEFDNMISSWCQEAGEDVTLEYVNKDPQTKSTLLNDDLPFWKAMQQATNDLGIKLVKVVCPAATDARYVRQQGIPAVNFSPIINYPPLIHCHDENIPVDVYKRGIDVTEKVVKAVANA